MKRILVLVLVALFMCQVYAPLAMAQRSRPRPAVTAEQWSADFDFLYETIVSTFPGVVDRKELSAVRRRLEVLKGKAGSATKEQMVVGMQEALAMLEDESCVAALFDRSIGFNFLPIKLYWFDDGIYIIDALEPYEALVGYQVYTIGNQNVDALFRKLSPVISADNYFAKQAGFLRYAICPEILMAKGVVNSTDEVKLLIGKPEEPSQEAIVRPIAPGLYRKLSQRLAQKGILEDLARKHTRDHYWFEYLGEERTLYVQVSNVRDMKEHESIKDFAKRLDEYANTYNNLIDRVVIDNRFGGGGDGFKLDPLVEVISENPYINKSGGLFILMGRNTQGTVLEFTSILEHTTAALFIGEPTGESPNGVSDAEIVTLPNSKVRVRIPKIFWPTTVKEDDRDALYPDFESNFTYVGYLNGEDPALGTALQYDVPGFEVLPIPEEDAKALKGNYEWDEGQQVSISLTDDRGLLLEVKQKGKSFFQVRSQLYQEAPSQYATDIRDVWMFVEWSEAGKVDRLVMEWKGHEKVLTKR